MKAKQRTAFGILPGMALMLMLGVVPSGVHNAYAVERDGAKTDSLAESPLSIREGYWQLEAAPGGASPNMEPEGFPLELNGDAWIYSTEDIFAPAPLVGQGDLRLDGDGDWAATAGPPVTGDGSFTVAVRARLYEAGDRDQTVFSLPGTYADRFAVRYHAATGKWELVVATEDRESAPRVVVAEEQQLPDDQQGASGQHLAVVFDAPSHELRFYVEGQLSQTSRVTDSTSWPATGGLQIGRSAVDGDYFAGAVDEVRAYSGVVDDMSIVRMAGLGGDSSL